MVIGLGNVDMICVVCSCGAVFHGRLFWIRIFWCLCPLHTITGNLVLSTRGTYVPSSYSSPHSKEKEDSSLPRLDLLGAVPRTGACCLIVITCRLKQYEYLIYSLLAIAKAAGGKPIESKHE